MNSEHFAIFCLAPGFFMLMMFYIYVTNGWFKDDLEASRRRQANLKRKQESTPAKPESKSDRVSSAVAKYMRDNPDKFPPQE